MTTGIGPCLCPPYTGYTVIDEFERTVSNAWGTPTRGTPDWVAYSQSQTAPSSSQIGVSAIGPSTGWGRINLTIDAPVNSDHGYQASRQMQLAVSEILDWDEFVLSFDLAVSPVSSRAGVAYCQIRLGGTGNAPAYPMIDLPFQFNHFTDINSDHLDFFQARDALAGLASASGTHNEQIAATHSFDGKITIDRSVGRGTTIVSVGPYGSFVFTPARSVFGSPEKKLYIIYSDYSQDATAAQSSTCSIDNLVLERGSSDPPIPYQLVADEYVGIGDGIATEFITNWPYVAGSLQIQVSGILSEFDSTDPGGDFTLADPAPLGARIIATYRASGA